VLPVVDAVRRTDDVRAALSSDLPALVEVLADPAIHPTPTLPSTGYV